MLSAFVLGQIESSERSLIEKSESEKMTRNTGSFIGGMIIALLIQNHALAADTTQLHVGYNLGNYAGYNANDYIVDLHGPYNGEVYDTAFSVSYVSGQPLPDTYSYTDPFTSFCMNAEADLVPDADWKAIAFSSIGAAQMAQMGYSSGTSGLNRAVNLYNAYVSTVNFNSQAGEINGGALQLAIWNVLYGSDSTSVSDPSSTFYATTVGRESAAAIAEANAFLDSPYNNPNQNYLTTFWEATDASGNPTLASNQSLIGLDPPDVVVPEPGTGAAAGAAGLYCFYVIMAGLRRSAARKHVNK